MVDQSIPQCDVAVVGGSSTNGIRFPWDVGATDVTLLGEDLRWETPYGESPAFAHFTLAGHTILSCAMHGWRLGIPRGLASQQVFWVLQQAGVTTVIGEGGVGAVNHLLGLRDVVVVNDYLDLSLRRDISLGTAQLLIMRDAICPRIAAALVSAAETVGLGRVFERGVYAVTDGRHFESRAEVAALRMWGADVVGQSLAPEVYLAREIGACYAGAYLVVNYAEGVVRDWQHEELAEIFHQDARAAGALLVEAIRRLDASLPCHCRELRKPTLLRGV